LLGRVVALVHSFNRYNLSHALPGHGDLLMTGSAKLQSILLTPMGSFCSKPRTHQGGHQVLGSTSGPSNPRNPPSSSDPRAAAAEAAERRLKAAQARGTVASNPNKGQLAAKAATKPKLAPEPRQEERLVWD